MQVENNREWWRIKVYNQVSEFLKHPNHSRKQQLQTALIEYEEIFNSTANNDPGNYVDLEASMNDC